MLTHSRRNTTESEPVAAQVSKKKSTQSNFAFVDSNNVYISVRNQGWSIDYSKFREYLAKEHNVTKAYIFIGFVEGSEAIYDSLHDAGFEIIYRPTLEYKVDGETQTKGNVDVELVLQAMIDKDNYNKAVIVSGDGDFYALINHLKEVNKLEKLIIPDKHKFSALLKEFAPDTLSLTDLKAKLRERRNIKKK